MRRYIHFVDRYITNSAGQRMSHYLCHLFNLAGLPSFLVIDPHSLVFLKDGTLDLINYPLTNPEWQTPILHGKKWQSITDIHLTEEDICIILEGKGDINPLHAKHIIRYFGYYASANYYPGGYWGGNMISSSEFILYYDSFLRDDIQKYCSYPLTDLKNRLFLPSIEMGLFHPEEKTIESCYYYGKGKRLWHNTKNIHLPKDAFEIGAFHPSNRQSLAKILNHCKTLYLFDPDCALSEEAQLAGCKVYYLYNQIEIKEYIRPNLQDYVQNPERDVHLIQKLDQNIQSFFNL